MVTARASRRRDVDAEARKLRLLRRRIDYRRSKLLQDARELSDLFGPHLAVLAFPQAGRPTLFGSPTVESVLRRFLPVAAGAETAKEVAGPIEAPRVAQEQQARLRAVAEKVKAAQEEQGREHWWEVDVDALGEAELPDFAKALDALRADVLRCIAKAPKPPQRRR
jgi:hypothetical protein